MKRQPNLKLSEGFEDLTLQRKDIQVANNYSHYEKMLDWLVIREMQTKRTMRYHFSRTRMPRGKQPDNKFYEGVEKLQPSHTAGENVKWGSHLGKSSAFPQKLKIELPHHPEVPFAGICPRELKKTLYTNVLSSIPQNSQRVAATPMSNLWMGNQTWSIHT